MPNGPSHFVEVYNVVYNSINIYAVNGGIRIRRQNQIITGEDNNKLRPVSSHKVRVSETVEFSSEDVNALKQLASQTGAHDLTFVAKAAEQTLTTSPLANQAVTIKNVVITSVDDNFVSKGLANGSVTGVILNTSDDTDPIIFANA